MASPVQIDAHSELRRPLRHPPVQFCVPKRGNLAGIAAGIRAARRRVSSPPASRFLLSTLSGQSGVRRPIRNCFFFARCPARRDQSLPPASPAAPPPLLLWLPRRSLLPTSLLLLQLTRPPRYQIGRLQFVQTKRNHANGEKLQVQPQRFWRLERQRGPPSRIGSQQPGSPNQDGPSSVGERASSLIQYQVHLRIHGGPGGDQRRAANEDGDGCDVRDPHDVARLLPFCPSFSSMVLAPLRLTSSSATAPTAQDVERPRWMERSDGVSTSKEYWGTEVDSVMFDNTQIMFLQIIRIYYANLSA